MIYIDWVNFDLLKRNRKRNKKEIQMIGLILSSINKKRINYF
jgi:hypothetical protein